MTQLVAFGQSLGAALKPGAVVWLEGELGAGKTTLVQALASGLGVAERPISPTYNLVHHYEGGGVKQGGGGVYHVDCFRLHSPAEAADLDWASIGSGDAVLIEWPERAGPWAPEPDLRIRLDHEADPERRRVTLWDGTAPW